MPCGDYFISLGEKIERNTCILENVLISKYDNWHICRSFAGFLYGEI